LFATDQTGLTMTVSSVSAVDHWNATVEHFLSHGRETPGALSQVLAADPNCLMGWCGKGFFSLLLARVELCDAARSALTKATASLNGRGATPRETLYVDALGEACVGRWFAAIAILETILDKTPTDSFAAKLSHALRFMLGDARGMRRSVERVLDRVGLDHPHVGYLLGCRAFALEETGAFDDAESIGRRALDRAPRDAWGLHAVSHVHEMTGRAREGAEFLQANGGAVDHCNNFAFHVFWHLALFRLELGDRAGALALYDSRIRADRTDDFRDIANAASLLARLEIDGVIVGSRWDELADIAERRIDDRSLVFADLHYLIALLGAGRRDVADAMIAAFARRDQTSDQGRIARAVGVATAAAIAAFYHGRFAEAASGLLHIRSALFQVGGSHAQRDVFEQILLEAMVRANMVKDAQLLMRERLARRTHNRFASERLTRMGQASRSGGLRAAQVPHVMHAAEKD
jgi:tetratricopeptide (TPR) repeat protein